MEPSQVRNRRGLWPPMAIMAMCVLGLSVPISAAAVTMAWDPNPEADMAGYKVYIGTSPGAYTQSIDVGHVTAFAVPGLLPGETYYFALTAYDIFANESGFSSEVSAVIPVTLPPADSSSPSATAERLHQKGQRLYEQGRYSGAIRAYRQAQKHYGELKNAEQRAAVFEDMARAFEAQGNVEAAAARYERARRIRERLAN